MAGGKRVAGVDFAMRCAVFGLPPRLTDEQELFLVLNSEVGRALTTHTAVEAARIAAGCAGPWEYYLMLSGGDEVQAAKLQGRAMLVELMNASR